jgi:hypothetical protein
MRERLWLIFFCLLVSAYFHVSAMAFDVLTHHYDASRTGWNNQESILTPGNVAGSGLSRFSLLHVVPLDERVNAQPLIWRDVVYVVTANNTVYAIDAMTGSVRSTIHLGDPVMACAGQQEAPLGILSTPVIDTQAQVMYLVTETLEDGDLLKRDESGALVYEVDPEPKNPKQDDESVRNRIDPLIPVTPTFDIGFTPGGKQLTRWIHRIPPDKHPEHKVHAIDLSTSTLAEKSRPQVVSASHRLQDGTLYRFSSLNSRQRAGLVSANENIYAAFTAACEYRRDVSRGWLLGWRWDGTTLAPLPGNTLINSLEPYPATGIPPVAYLSGIWMSGFGVAADNSGNLFFVTSNGGPNTYGAPYNLANSVMKVSGDLTQVIDYFTPSNVNALDDSDQDFGAGGVLLMPNQPGSKPHLAVAAGKSSDMFLLDRDHLGRFHLPVLVGGALRPDNDVLGTYSIGNCYCGPSFFEGSDGTPRIVSSGDNEIIIWKVQTDPAPALVQEHMPTTVAGAGSGFFTSVSSNGLLPATAIIWAVHDLPPTLSAFNAATGEEIHSWVAGSWHQWLGRHTIVPVVANGRVYVASDHQLAIFGLEFRPIVLSPLSASVKEDPNRGGGEVRSLDGSRIILGTPEGTEIQVDASKAFENHLSIPFAVGSPITVYGQKDENGIIRADYITYSQPTARRKK